MIKLDNILLINLGGIGDILLSVPALAGLRRRFPLAKIRLLTAARNAEFAVGLGSVDEVFGFSVGHAGRMPLGKIWENLRVLLKLRKIKIDVAVNMRPLTSWKSVVKVRVMLWLINPKLCIGRNTEGRGGFYDQSIPESDRGKKHERDYDLELLELLGTGRYDRTITFKIESKYLQKINALLLNQGIQEEDILIGIHPGGLFSRRWPIKNFAQVIRNIAGKTSAKFIITGGKDEIVLGKELETAARGRVINLSGAVSIRELFALISRCQVFVSNDTGPMHLAAVLKIPLVAIFGPGDLGHYDPRVISPKTRVLYKNADCGPCNRVTCSDLKCLRQISAEEVTQAVMELLAERRFEQNDR